jgi:hypothetical protein
MPFTSTQSHSHEDSEYSDFEVIHDSSQKIATHAAASGFAMTIQ